jgi:hypothetical protein
MDTGSLKNIFSIIGHINPRNMPITLLIACCGDSRLVFTLPRTCLYSISTKSQNSFNSSTRTVYIWKYWNILFTKASTSTGKISALVQKALHKMWAEHPRHEC